MSRRPIDPRIDSSVDSSSETDENDGGGPGANPDGLPSGISSEVFRDTLALWATGVSIVAARDPDDGRVYATTVSSLVSLSAEPPRIAFSLGGGAQVLPFLPEGRRFMVNVLSQRQRDLASRFTDAFPVGPSPFAPEGDPLIAGSHARMACVVEQVVPVDPSRIVIALVVEADGDRGIDPLVYHDREYRALS